MKRELLRASDFNSSATNRREKGQIYLSDNLRPANLTDNQESAVLSVFYQLHKARVARDEFLALTEDVT